MGTNVAVLQFLLSGNQVGDVQVVTLGYLEFLDGAILQEVRVLVALVAVFPFCLVFRVINLRAFFLRTFRFVIVGNERIFFERRKGWVFVGFLFVDGEHGQTVDGLFLPYDFLACIFEAVGLCEQFAGVGVQNWARELGLTLGMLGMLRVGGVELLEVGDCRFELFYPLNLKFGAVEALVALNLLDVVVRYFGAGLVSIHHSVFTVWLVGEVGVSILLAGDDRVAEVSAEVLLQVVAQCRVHQVELAPGLPLEAGALGALRETLEFGPSLLRVRVRVRMQVLHADFGVRELLHTHGLLQFSLVELLRLFLQRHQHGAGFFEPVVRVAAALLPLNLNLHFACLRVLFNA
mmetsp:Transcript_32184/g.70116  ORF Transcript_32184/g.70116 Transcript_32184/m.70116 type:complete len:348 (-) Transcript_32184:93-1136(-)